MLKKFQAVQSISNNIGIGIYYEDGSDHIWGKYIGIEKRWRWRKYLIQYDENGRAFFSTKRGFVWYIDEFVKIDN